MKINTLIFETIPFWIFILMPVFLITGPFLSDFGVSLVAILFIINSFKQNLTKYYRNNYCKFFFLFCFLLILSSLLSENKFVSLRSSIFYFRFGLFSLYFWYMLDKNNKLINYLFKSFLLCFSCLIIDGYIQYIFGQNIFGFKLINQYRVSSFFGSELILGSYLARFFPILFGLFILFDKSKKNKKMLFFVTIIFILSETLILLSGERLALFFMNMSAIFIIIMIKEYKIYRLWTYLVSLFLIIVILNFFPNSKERIVDKTLKDISRGTLLNNDAKDDKFYLFSKPYNDMYITGFHIFLDNKFFGVGPREYRNKCKDYIVSEYSCHTHPHNTYIELISEAGIFAFFMVFIVFINLCYISIKHLFLKLTKNKNGIISDFEVCLLSSILISLWPLSPSGSFFNNWISIVYYFPVGLLLWQKHKKKKIII